MNTSILDDSTIYPVTLKIIDRDENCDDEILANNPQLENSIIRYGNFDDDNDGCCFNYALNNDDLIYCEDAFDIIKGDYNKVNILEAQEGDIVVYFNDCFEPKHFAVIQKTDGTIKNTIIRSKWGCFGVYETTIEEVPELYGYYCQIWRKKS